MAALAVVVILLVELITLSTLPLRLNPAAFKLLPVMFPVALINPPVSTLPPITLPETIH